MILSYEHLRVDGELTHPKWDPLVRVVAAFRITSGEATLYSEPDFPVVEFAAQLASWVDRVRAGNVSDFHYTTIESDEGDWIWFHRVEPDDWRVGARHEDRPDPQAHSLQELLSASERYLATLVTEAREQLGVEIESLLRSDE